jgi:hypothetical protein
MYTADMPLGYYPFDCEAVARIVGKHKLFRANIYSRCYFILDSDHIFRVCVCSLTYPAYTAHALRYIVVCGLFGSNRFFHIIS